MGNFFKTPKPAPVEPVAPPPALEDTRAQAQDYADRIRKRRGRLSTVLVPDAFGQPAGASAQALNKPILGG